MKTNIVRWDQVSPHVQTRINSQPITGPWWTLWETKTIITEVMFPGPEWVGIQTAENILNLCNNELDQIKSLGFEEANIILHNSLPDQDKLNRYLNLKMFW